MNTPAFGALLRDAIYQVLDNWVFRILAVLIAILVLTTFVFGFRQDGIVLLFGLEHWSYDAFLDTFSAGGAPNAPSDAQGMVIDILVKILFEGIAGNLGVLACVAATAFFVPAMLQKGAADVLFHKPLPRLTFYLARYIAGLLFVGSLATLMSVGVYLGFLLVSQYNDPGILLAGPLITYIFALVYAVSMWVGVMTRSTVAAILLTVIFFSVNGCIHRAWGTMTQNELTRTAEVEAGRDLRRKERSNPEAAPEAGAAEEDQADLDTDEIEDTESAFVTWMRRTITTLHYILPKTGDADVLAHKMRRVVNRPAFTDGTSLVSVFRIPDGFERVSPAEVPPLPNEARALVGEPVLTLKGSLGDAPVTYTLLRRDVSKRTVERRGKSREVLESNSQAAQALREALEAAGATGISRTIMSLGANMHGNPMGAALLDWTEGGHTRRVAVFKGANGERLYTLWIEDGGMPSEERDKLVFDTIHRAMGYDLKANSYEERFTLTAPWRYNILFSVGSSLAFVAVLLLLGWWKLRRIEF
ncbi:MAG TPA: hypothetical protein ENJ09_04000 [Planctomycetes bacterium]|nr:hypothetical protein [Planctomycetota bacterium]